MCSRGTSFTDEENEQKCSVPQPAGECVGMSRYAEKLYGAKAPLGNVGQKKNKMCSVYTKMKERGWGRSTKHAFLILIRTYLLKYLK